MDTIFISVGIIFYCAIIGLGVYSIAKDPSPVKKGIWAIFISLSIVSIILGIILISK